MTKKRFLKLTRAYFTRLNEWAKENSSKTLNMKEVYKKLNNIDVDIAKAGMTRDEWWNRLTVNANNFGVGVKEK